MGVIEKIFIALGLAMDAFAVAICLGLKMKKATLKKAIIVGCYFGLFQGAMPLIGYFLARMFADKIIAFDHWIAFVLLLFLGGKMIIASFQKEEKRCKDRECPESMCEDRECPARQGEPSMSPKEMLPFAIATSIDALAIGVSFAFLKVEIFSSVSIIAAVTLVISMMGVKIGNIFGTKIKSKAEFAGGIILVLIGAKILIEHLFF